MPFLSRRRRIVVLGPHNSGRRSALGGLHEAIQHYAEFELEASQGTGRLVNAIQSGEYPTHTQDRLQVFTLNYSTKGFMPRTVEIVLPVVSDGYLDPLLNELTSTQPKSPRQERHGRLASDTSWRQAINDMRDAKVKLSFIQSLVDTIRAADLVVGTIPLVDFPGPILSLVHEDPASGVSLPPIFRDRFVKKSKEEITNPEKTIKTKAGIFVDTARKSRPQPAKYLEAYTALEDSSHLSNGLQLVVTMGDIAKSHFQTTLDETETIQTSQPTAFCDFIKDTYFTYSATYNRSELRLPEAINRRPAVVWYDQGVETDIALRGTSSPLHGSLGLLLRAAD